MSPKLRFASVLCFVPVLCTAQDNLKAIIERLDRLEQENRALREEMRSLRLELAAQRPATAPESSSAPLTERVEVLESRTADLAQTKVETSSRFPLTITGMALFNAFYNTPNSGDAQYPTTASATPSAANAGGTLRQSIIGLRFQGPGSFAGAKISGSIYTDFFAGSDSSLNHLIRIRTATIQMEWKNTTLIAAQDKPLISIREPDSLAQVGVSPLTSAGNPWLWQPQIRVEQRFALGDSTGFRAQGALYQTSESRTNVPNDYTGTVAPSRPGWEGRFELWRNVSEGRRFELAPGFHISDSHVAGYSIPSRIFSFDWRIRPTAKIDFTGLFFKGRNIAPLGALRQGYFFFNNDPRAVHTIGGWGELAWHPTSRLTFNAFTGQQDDRNSDLVVAGRIGKNLAYGANTMFRIAPNVILSFEGANIRTTYLGTGVRSVTHYDLALAYLF